MAYWYHGLILALLAFPLLLASVASRQTTRRGLLVCTVALGGAVVALLPAVLPIVPLLSGSGTSATVSVAPWGTALPTPGGAEWSAMRLDSLILEQVPTDLAVSPFAGFIPGLPMLVFAALGARRRRGWPWVACGAVGMLLMIGPVPASVEVMSTPGIDDSRLGSNPIAALAWQWIPLYSRMVHPRRMALLVVIAGAALAALGAASWREHKSRVGGLLVAGAVWTVLAGPLPYAAWPFPGVVADKLATCSAIVHAPNAEADSDDIVRKREFLATLHHRPWTPPSSRIRNALLDPALEGVATNLAANRLGDGDFVEPEVAEGALRSAGENACLVLDWWGSFSEDAEPLRRTLTALLGEPEKLELPKDSFPDLGPRSWPLWLWRAPGSDPPATP
jgi:hypothetical protein